MNAWTTACIASSDAQMSTVATPTGQQPHGWQDLQL